VRSNATPDARAACALLQHDAGVPIGSRSLPEVAQLDATRQISAMEVSRELHPDVRDGFAGAVGQTPLVRIPSLSALTGCTILGKAELLNPGGSVKDRAAKAMIDDAERQGLLRAPDRTLVVEGTAGNTGIGLALMCRARGYRCVIVMPNNQSEEKVTTLRALGAEVELVPPAPFADEGNYYHVARRRAAELGGFWANQFENLANARAHEQGTALELWSQSGGRVDGFVCSAGTGGTIGGVSRGLKAINPAVQCYVVDADGSSLYAHVTKGTLDAPGSSFLEGIGIRRITANFAYGSLDGAFRGSDAEAVAMVYWLLKKDGLFVGGSAALNCVGAVKLARKLGPGHTIATVLCDGAGRYQARLFNRAWLAEKGVVDVDFDDLSFVKDV
jgi:cysteine synthase A